MNSTLISHKAANPFSLSALQDPVEITLLGIIIEKAQLFVILTDGQRNRTLELKASVLRSFPRFQQYLLDELNVLVSHQSQDSPSVRLRRHDWQTALRIAYERGMG